MAIYVQPSEIWSFFQEHRKELASKYMLVADNHDDAVEIYLTEEDGMPFFQVEVAGKCESEADSISKVNAENNYRELISLFIECDRIGEILDTEDVERLDEIKAAAEDFLFVLLGCSPEEACIEDDDVDQIVDLVEEFLCEQYGIPIYHPTIVENEETGEAEVVMLYEAGEGTE